MPTRRKSGTCSRPGRRPACWSGSRSAWRRRSVAAIITATTSGRGSIAEALRERDGDRRHHHRDGVVGQELGQERGQRVDRRTGPQIGGMPASVRRDPVDDQLDRAGLLERLRRPPASRRASRAAAPSTKPKASSASMQPVTSTIATPISARISIGATSKRRQDHHAGQHGEHDGRLAAAVGRSVGLA